jgi:hypothetical protein
MDFALHDTFARFRQRISVRIPTLPRDPLATQRFRRHLLTGASLAFALGAAIWAHELTRDIAWEEWENSRAPSVRAWEHGLGGQGFRHLVAPDEVRKADRKLPLRFDHPGAIWVAGDSSWIAVFGDGSSSGTAGGEPFRLYCSGDCHTYPTTWSPVGSGWPAFDALLARLEARPPQITAPGVKKKKPGNNRDRREIQY